MARQNPAAPPHIHTGNDAKTADGTNAGMDCGQCHGPGGDGPAFLFGGTVFTVGGTTPDTGITIKVTQNGTALAPLQSDTAGNFYYEGGTPGGTFTATLSVCPGPDTVMPGTFTQLGCATAGCHVTGADGPITGN